MKFLFALALVTALAAGGSAPGHGNNPDLEAHGNNPTWQWAGVNIAGTDMAIPGDLYIILQMLAPGLCGELATGCADLAVTICGEGRVCCFCVVGSNGDESCFFSCQDSEGNCEPCPECNPSAGDFSVLPEWTDR
jgi:hypothetical protein